MKTRKDFEDVQHIIVDEGQNFRSEDGDWFKKAKKITNEKSGTFWIFLDYFQQTHVKPSGLPDVSDQFRFNLHHVVRNGTAIFDAMKGQLQFSNLKRPRKHLEEMIDKIAVAHNIKGEFSLIQDSELVLAVVNKVVDLIEKQPRFSPGDIAVLFSKIKSCEKHKVEKMLTQKNIQYSDVENMNEELIVVDTVRRFSGLERDIVLLVNITARPLKITPSLKIAGYSRARLQLFDCSY